MCDFKSTIVSIICGMMISSTGAHANSIETKLDGLITDFRSSCEGTARREDKVETVANERAVLAESLANAPGLSVLE